MRALPFLGRAPRVQEEASGPRDLARERSCGFLAVCGREAVAPKKRAVVGGDPLSVPRSQEGAPSTLAARSSDLRSPSSTSHRRSDEPRMRMKSGTSCPVPAVCVSTFRRHSDGGGCMRPSWFDRGFYGVPGRVYGSIAVPFLPFGQNRA
mmetsp:Transcript_12728/g.28096  ORF Transcript_12728/g.28096 Transcript_12728/m.28096 type:complete len:150 (-) Transcript_12728:204-653(-)